MATFIAFLRAVNVGKRAYPMAELRDVLARAGFERVETHIQTGNVRLGTDLADPAEVVAALEAAMLADRGFEVPVVLFTLPELTEAYAEALDAAAGRPLVSQYVALTAEPLTPEAAAALAARSLPGEKIRPGRRAVHLLLDKRFSEAATGNAEVERHAGTATTRNLTVLTKLIEKWSP